MATTVTVFETTARRTVIKVTPGKYLHEIRAEACQKFKLDADKYGLRYNNKTLDLSTPFRHTGLAAGARLELSLLSRSAGVVTVALQLPVSEAADASNARLVDKFPSTTTLWQILRKFEDGVAGTAAKRNLTARGVPLTSDGGSGAGRLYYEQPFLVIMHRELGTFVDLQKTLSALGLNAGNVLLKLSFKPTQQPFEDAQAQIGQYFQGLEGSSREIEASQGEEAQEEKGDASLAAEAASTHEPPRAALTELDPVNVIQEPEASRTSVIIESSSSAPETTSLALDGITDRPTTIFAAPSNSRPQAAAIPHNEKDFEYTVEHAQIQHAQYKSAGRNRTLPSDAQVEAKKKEAAERVAAVQSVKIRTRFPDNTQTIAEFNQHDSGQDLYSHVRKLLNHEDAPFTLRFRGSKGMTDLPDDSKKRLIQDVGMTGDATVFLTWGKYAGPDVRKEPALKSRLTAAAKQIEVPLPAPEAEQQDPKENMAPDKSEKPGKKGGAMPAWLKKTLPGGKK